MGAVYRAKDLELDREVAIKVLREELSRDPSRIERLKREARAASALSHHNIITIYEIGSCEAGLYFVMELIRGGTLRNVMDGGALAVAELVGLGGQLAGLARAHEGGIVHRDLKPGNVMVTRLHRQDTGLWARKASHRR